MASLEQKSPHHGASKDELHKLCGCTRPTKPTKNGARKKNMQEQPLTQQQAIAISLIKTDLRFLFTIVKHSERFKSNYWLSFMPYMGIMIDGVEDWLQAYNRSSKYKITAPTFKKEEQQFYGEMRSAIKMWGMEYDELYQKLKILYEESDRYFSSLCRPIAKKLHLYDIFGVDLANDQYCGNTILCSFNSPRYKFNNDSTRYGEHIMEMAKIGGKYIATFGAVEAYKTDPFMTFSYKDYGGFIKSPVGNSFSDKFMLFSLLCQIQFSLLCIDEFVLEECATKLRFLYLQYYYTVPMIEKYNSKTGRGISIDKRWVSKGYRNAMAHYKVGVALRTGEILFDDPLFGLTQKFFGCDSATLKRNIKIILESVAQQIKEQLSLSLR